MANNPNAYYRAAAGGTTSPVSSPTSDNDSGGGGGGGGGAAGGGAAGGSGHGGEYIREQDRLLPIANVGRIMKRALPNNAKISKEAKETVQECVSEFISFITGEASDKCQREKRKTINGDDLLWGMTTLGFEEYVDPLKLYLAKYRELEGEKSTMAKQGERELQQQHQHQQHLNGGNHHGHMAYAHHQHRGPGSYGDPSQGR